MKIARHELQQFEQVFSKNKLPDDMPTFTWSELSPDAESNSLVNLMAASQLFESKGAIRRLVEQGGVKIDSEKQNDPNFTLSRNNEATIIQAGKRIFFKLVG